MTQSENSIKIEGILSEINLEERTFVKNGINQKGIGGYIKVRVDTVIDGNPTTLEIPIHMFTSQYTNKGTENPAYASMMELRTYDSIASTDINTAACVRITRASVRMNEYYDKTGAFVSSPRIHATFVQKIAREQMKPEASGTITFVVGKKGYEVDADGVETNRYKITGIVPQYGDVVDVIPFYATNPGVIDGISSYWQEGDTVRCAFKVNFSSRVELQTTPVDFGEPVVRAKTISVSDLIITGGAASPLEGDAAYDENEISAALAERTKRLAELKDTKKKESAVKTTKAAPNKFADLGF